MDMAHMVSEYKTDASAPCRTVVDGRKPKTKWRKLISLLEDGLSLSEAAQRVPTTYGSAKTMLSIHRAWIKKPDAIKPRRAPNGSGKGETITVRLPVATAKALEREAGRRGISRNRLISDALRAVTADNLFDAVLDGGDGD